MSQASTTDPQSTLSTHILDLDAGAPASGVAVTLHQLSPTTQELSRAITDSDGRIGEWPTTLELNLGPGTYELRFAVQDWYKTNNTDCFYPHISVAFSIRDKRHYHVPLLLNRHGYSTYRGS